MRKLNLSKTLHTFSRSAEKRRYKQTIEMYSEEGQTNEGFEKEEFGETDNEVDKKHDIFCQMDVLRAYNDDVIWKEIRRWVKFEEVLEEKGKRWSKPHVSSLTMQSLSELQMLLATSPFIFDVDANSMYDIVDIILERWRKEGQLENILWNHVRSVLLKRHKHHHINSKQVKRHESKRHEVKQTLTLRYNGTASCPDFLQTDFQQNQDQTTAENESNSNPALSSSSSGDEYKDFLENFSFGAEENRKFKRKIPAGAEVLNIMVGEVKELNYRLGALVRLNKAKDVGTTEVSLPTRFIFILLVPRKQLDESIEVGRCMGTLMTDQIFRDAAYKCTNKIDLIRAVQNFASHVTVLPPGCWDPKIRLEPPPSLPAQETSRNNKEVIIEMDEEEEHDSHYDPTLERTGRVFGGLVNDVKRKFKWYKSDFTDALHIQCLASFIYLFLATLTPNVTFGGLLGQATDNYMGTMECILAASITGIVFALFSGQPLNILGSTGPMLVLEMILYNFSKEFGWDFMPLRVWVGMWTSFLLIIIVAFDLSSLVRYITRFTEECFACLIAFIFIYQAVAKLLEIGHMAPVHLHPSEDNDNCFCIVNNDTLLRSFVNSDRPINISKTAVLDLKENLTSIDFSGQTNNLKELGVENCTELGGILIGSGCDVSKYVPDVFFFSILLFIGTFIIAVGLVKARNGSFFPNIVRQTLSDFSVLMAIVCMVGLDAALGLPTPKLTVPNEFKPTRSDRGWFINPVGDHNPWWLIPASIIPAILATILVFMDQQITSVIVNRKEHKLQKGGGYHLDLLVVAILISVCSVLGLPWYVAATVTAIAHVMSLKKESECTAPGEKPTFLGVREQRVTALLVGIFSGLAVFITSVLKYIPMPVLYGVFFYMGISALNGMQLFERILIIFMPQKHQPDYPYLRHVPLTRVYLFTGIQILCLVFLWVIKSIKEIAIVFPVMVLAICFVRKALDFFFCQYDLKWLDEILPGAKKNPPKKEDEQVSFTIEGYKQKKFMRSISVPATVQPSPPKRSALGSWLSNPVLSRTLSTESIKVALSSKISGYGPQRKVSILSLPSHPTFLLNSDDSDSNSEKDREFDIEDSCT